MDVVGGLLLIVGAYLLGGIPWGVVLGRLVGRIDLRNYGSHSTGATNALRVLGWRVSVAVLLLDIGKGVLPVVIGRAAGLPDWYVALAGLAAVVGHCWSPYIGFTGGKGVATGAGAALALAPWLLLLIPLMVAIVWLTRYVSLASIVCAAAAAVALLILALTGNAAWAVAVAVVAIAAIIVYKHQSNIRRLLSGTENRFGQRAATS